MYKQSLTLVELILSIVLLSVIILAAAAFNYTSLSFFQSSQRKAVILNEVALIEDHLAKYTSEAAGDVSNPGIRSSADKKAVMIRVALANSSAVPSTLDIWVHYRYNPAAHSIEFCPDWQGTSSTGSCNAVIQDLTKRVTLPIFSFSSNVPNEVTIKDLNLLYDLKKSFDPRNNPKISMPVITFCSLSQSIN